MTFSNFARFLGSTMLATACATSVFADEQPTRAPGQTPPARSSDPQAEKLDLNTASLATLEAMPAIGPDGARAIIAARPFKSVDELDRVKGLSAERLEQIRSQVVVRPAGNTDTDSMGLPRASVRATDRKARVDLNTADVKTLEALPSVGPELARAIVAARPFATLDDLGRVRGISAERLEQIRAETTISAPPSTSPKPGSADARSK